MVWLWIGLLTVLILMGLGLWLVVDLLRSLFRWIFSDKPKGEGDVEGK